MEILTMKSCHVAAVAQLETQCFSDPWSEKSVEGEVHNPLSLWLVAVDGARVVGYVGSQSVQGEADMMNLAVSADWRRQGIATALITALTQRLKENGVHSLTLEVRASNENAIALYQTLGFSAVGRRPNYYRHPKEDACIFRKEWEI